MTDIDKVFVKCSGYRISRFIKESGSSSMNSAKKNWNMRTSSFDKDTRSEKQGKSGHRHHPNIYFSLKE